MLDPENDRILRRGDGKVVIVTGAGRGIARAWRSISPRRARASRGGFVAERAEEHDEEIERAGGTAVPGSATCEAKPPCATWSSRRAHVGAGGRAVTPPGGYTLGKVITSCPWPMGTW